jgi:hypothetical protein
LLQTLNILLTLILKHYPFETLSDDCCAHLKLVLLENSTSLGHFVLKIKWFMMTTSQLSILVWPTFGARKGFELKLKDHFISICNKNLNYFSHF